MCLAAACWTQLRQIPSDELSHPHRKPGLTFHLITNHQIDNECVCIPNTLSLFWKQKSQKFVLGGLTLETCTYSDFCWTLFGLFSVKTCDQEHIAISFRDICFKFSLPYVIFLAFNGNNVNALALHFQAFCCCVNLSFGKLKGMHNKSSVCMCFDTNRRKHYFIVEIDW